LNRFWEENINDFIRLANIFDVKMIMVGGGAVNFHGYQRHSADVDFWLDVSEENLNNLLKVLKKMNYEIDDFPKEIKEKKQNISIKFSPIDINLELITKFDVNKTFQEALNDSIEVKIEANKVLKWNVLSLDDLITSKLKAGRNKDLLDVKELIKINNIK